MEVQESGADEKAGSFDLPTGDPHRPGRSCSLRSSAGSATSSSRFLRQAFLLTPSTPSYVVSRAWGCEGASAVLEVFSGSWRR